MFAKLPSRLTAPIGLLRDEAKLAFRSQPDGISKLASTRNISEHDAYWDQYLQLFDTPSDVFTLISPHDVRRAFLDAPENIATLIRVLTSRLFNLVSDHTFPSSAPSSMTAYTSFLKTGSSERNTTKEVLNCLRVLQRVLPVVFEVEGELNTFELEVLWKKVEVEDEDEGTQGAQAPQFVIADDDEDIEEDSEPTESQNPNPSNSQGKPKKTLPSLGEKLFSCMIDLMFCCGFTLPSKLQVDHYKINYIIWEKGIGSTSDPGPSHAYDSNKIEVLRLLLVLLSRQIYVSPSSLFTKPSFYSLHIIRKIPRRDVLTILCSLLNTTMNSSKDNTVTIGSMAGKLPYNHLVFKGEDPRVALVSICFQVLCVLLDFQSGPARDAVVGSGDNVNTSPTAHTNSFRYFLAKLHRVQDFAYILDGIFGIMEQQLATYNILLPGARKSVPYIHETVLLLWKMIELNKKFRAYIMESDRGVDLLAYLLCYNLQIKDKPEQHGLCRALSYIVQTLSAEPAFGNKLSSPIRVQLPAKWATAGTAADFLIISVYSIIATTSGALNSIYPALIIALSNAAPYFRNLSVTSSTRLLQLLTSFSNPLFLLSDEGHPRLLFFMLEVFNSVIFYRLTENPNLLHAILSAHRTFEELGTFTLLRGLREIRRVQLAKEEQARNAATAKKGRDVSEGAGLEDAHAEKARLLRSESSTGLIFDSAENVAGSRSNLENVEEDGPQEDTTVTRPLMSPTSETAPSMIGSSQASEKARGKMRARSSTSSDMSNGLEHVAAAGIGRNGFVPTQEWVTSWQQGLPLDIVMLVISELLPKIQDLHAARQTAHSAAAITDFLQSVNLSHVLPPAPPISPRRFIWSDASIVWLTSLIWGEIYVRGMSPLGIWNSTNVRLFYVKHSPTQQRQIGAAVSNVVGGLLSPVSRQGSDRV